MFSVNKNLSNIHIPIGEDPDYGTKDIETKSVLAGDTNNDGELSVKERFVFAKGIWRRAPKTVRRSVVGVLGLTLILIGGVLVILPGPFTLPFVIAGLAVLASEFVWAERLLVQGRKRVGNITSAVRRKARRR